MREADENGIRIVEAPLEIDRGRDREAALAMKTTAPDLHALDIVDEVIPEVTGGAHVDPARQAVLVGDVIERQLRELRALDPRALVAQRFDRFRKLGRYADSPA